MIYLIYITKDKLFKNLSEHDIIFYYHKRKRELPFMSILIFGSTNTDESVFQFNKRRY
jgi:hypothetical protein